MSLLLSGVRPVQDHHPVCPYPAVGGVLGCSSGRRLGDGSRRIRPGAGRDQAPDQTGKREPSTLKTSVKGSSSTRAGIEGNRPQAETPPTGTAPVRRLRRAFRGRPGGGRTARSAIMVAVPEASELPLPGIDVAAVGDLSGAWDDGGLWADVITLARRFAADPDPVTRAVAWHHFVLAVGNELRFQPAFRNGAVCGAERRLGAGSRKARGCRATRAGAQQTGSMGSSAGGRSGCGRPARQVAARRPSGRRRRSRRRSRPQATRRSWSVVGCRRTGRVRPPET